MPENLPLEKPQFSETRAEALKEIISPPPNRIKELLAQKKDPKESGWVNDWTVISQNLIAEEIPQDKAGRVLRIEAVVTACYKDVSESSQVMVGAMVRDQLRLAGKEITDPEISLVSLAENLRPLVAILEEEPEVGTAISPEDGARLEQLGLLEQAARELGLSGVKDFPETVQTQKWLLSQLSDEKNKVTADLEKIKRRAEKAEGKLKLLARLDEKAKDLNLSKAEDFPEALAQLKREIQEAKEIAKLARKGEGVLGKLDASLAEFESSTATAIAHLLKTIQDSLGEEKFNSLLAEAAKTFEQYQFVRPGETVELREISYEIVKKLGGGATGEVFLAEIKGGWQAGTQVAWKASKDQRYLEREYMALVAFQDIQEKAGLKENEYTPAYWESGDKEQNFALPFFVMEYVSGKNLLEVADDIKDGKRPPLKEEEVVKIFSQVAHFGFLLEGAKEVKPTLYGKGELSLAGDFKQDRIKIYDEESLRIKIVDWSLPTLEEKDLPGETRSALEGIGYGISHLLGEWKEELSSQVGSKMREIILRCKEKGDPQKFPPYATFGELYKDLAEFS